jgi:hypothetical protein
MLHAEEQNQQPVPAPQNTPQADSDESKSKSNRGGKRAGAGRKPNLAKRLLRGFTRDAIAAAIQDMDVGKNCGCSIRSLRS